MQSRRKLLVTLGILSTVFFLEGHKASATPGCQNDPTGTLAWCCESRGQILYEQDRYCWCGDDNGNPYPYCGG